MKNSWYFEKFLEFVVFGEMDFLLGKKVDCVFFKLVLKMIE